MAGTIEIATRDDVSAVILKWARMANCPLNMAEALERIERVIVLAKNRLDDQEVYLLLQAAAIVCRRGTIDLINAGEFDGPEDTQH